MVSKNIYEKNLITNEYSYHINAKVALFIALNANCHHSSLNHV